MPKPTGAVFRVSDALVQRIISEEYSPGLRLPSEIDLSVEFACGRSTIREALRHLAGLNLVQSRRGSGAVVLDFRREGGLELMAPYFQYGKFDHPLPVMVKEMLRLRSMLACEAARLAATYASAAAIVSLRRKVEWCDSAREDAQEHSLRELELFRSMAQSSLIWPYAWLANAFTSSMREVLKMVAGSLSAVPPNWVETMSVLMGHVERHDPDSAVQHLGAHFRHVDGLVAQGLEELFAGRDVLT